jgi:hypothetical protein
MIQRWGAFSVIDYKDARKLAAEVLLYDGILVPTPIPTDIERWTLAGWDPEQLQARLNQLGSIAIKADWDQAAQKAWKEKMEALHQDVKDVNEDEDKRGFKMTRRVLVDQERRYRPQGVTAVEAFAAYQSEEEFNSNEQHRGAPTEEFNFQVAQRVMIPDEEDPEESLKRALDVAHKDSFIRRRSRFHDFQRGILASGIVPPDAARDIGSLIAEYNETVRASDRKFRTETVILIGTIGAAALAVAAGVAPGLFAAGIGAFSGVQVATVGAGASGALLQIATFALGRRESANAASPNPTGAMFHQIEEETGWTYRTTAQ